MKRILLSAVLLLSIGLNAQVGVNTEQPKAMLEIKYDEALPSGENQTFGLPKVSIEQRDKFEHVEAGQMIWNTTKKCIDYYDGKYWQCTDGSQKQTKKCREIVKDKYYGDGVHDFVYCGIEAPDGNIWLSNNLGADYANIHKDVYDIEAQAKSTSDYHAYGSLFQLGRPVNGYEIIDWTSNDDGNFKKEGWKSLNEILSGTFEDPCPVGYSIPTRSEFLALASGMMVASGTTDYSSNDFSFEKGKMRFAYAGARDDDKDNGRGGAGTGELFRQTEGGYYVSRSEADKAEMAYEFSGGKGNMVLQVYPNPNLEDQDEDAQEFAVVGYNTAFGMSVRCIKKAK